MASQDIANIRARSILGKRDPFSNIDFGAGIPSPNPPFDNVNFAPQVQAQVPVEELSSVPEEVSLTDQIRDFYKPQTAASDRYNELLNSPPEMQEPSVMRRLTATMGGLGHGGFDLSKKILDEPYALAATEFKAKEEPYSRAAQQENTANANERQLVSNMLTAKSAADKLVASEKIAARKADIEKIKLQLVAEKQNGTTFTVAGGHFIAHKQDGTSYDTGLDVRDANPVEVANILSAAAQRRVETQGDTARDVAAIRGQTAETVAGSKGTPFNIPDPTDPTKQMGVMVGPDGQAVPIVVSGKQAGPIARPLGGGAGAGFKQPPNIQAIQNTAQETIQMLDQILDNKTNKIKPEIMMAIGKNRMDPANKLASYIPGTQRKAADAKINRLKQLLVLELLGEMKQQSRTGATGFGQLSGRELDVLEAAASNLDPALDDVTFTSELVRIREKLGKILLPADGLTPTTTTTPTTGMTPDDYLLKFPARPRR